MKKLSFLLVIVMLILTSCVNNSPMKQSDTSSVKEENSFPINFTLDNIDVSFLKVSETKNIEFNDNGTKIKLNNDDGKYITVIYSMKNNEAYDIDIDHSLEVYIKHNSLNSYFGEYYENKTGRENVILKSGETKEVIFIYDVEQSLEFDEIIFKYNGNEYVYKKNNG